MNLQLTEVATCEPTLARDRDERDELLLNELALDMQCTEIRKWMSGKKKKSSSNARFGRRRRRGGGRDGSGPPCPDIRDATQNNVRYALLHFGRALKRLQMLLSAAGLVLAWPGS